MITYARCRRTHTMPGLAEKVLFLKDQMVSFIGPRTGRAHLIEDPL
jgi:hypothetical protein